MVGLSDIPCVGKIVDRISEATVDVIFRGLQYMFCYKALVNDLISETEKLNIEEVRISRKVVEARADGKIIYDHILKWQTDVVEIDESAKVFKEKYENRHSWRCIQCLPIPNPISRFTLGNEAVHKTKRITELYDSGKELLDNQIAYLPLAENVRRTDSAFQNFQSREDVYEKLREVLVTEGSAQILGIYGMAGVSKTRTMEQLWKEVKEKAVFDIVVRVDVSSEKFDAAKLQYQIAGQLNCHFDLKDSVEGRASQIRSSLVNSGKSLIILDDVWSEIDLDTIGILFDDGSSSSIKILMTSRDKEVCLHNNCKYVANITPLTTDEAWDIFSSTVGIDNIDSLQDETLAKKVCDKCARLPLVIHVVGKALKFRQHCSWKDTLDQLENCRIERVPGISADVYASLKLSFDNLEEDAKRCLLLCSLLPEDTNIDIGELFQLATGSQLVHGQETRVRAMVDILKSSSLLLEAQNEEATDVYENFRNESRFIAVRGGELSPHGTYDYIAFMLEAASMQETEDKKKYDEAFKLHDIVRDMARSMSVTDPNYGFIFARCGLRLPDNYAEYGTGKVLHLDLEKNDFHFPDDLLCPHLHTLYLRSLVEWIYEPERDTTSYIAKISGGIFGNLRFLVLADFSFEQQFSLQHLNRLKTLVLERCDMSYIDKTDVSFFPESLDTLCICKCNLPVLLDLPNLTYLRKLDIQRSAQKLRMVPNAISNLSNLEELHIRPGFFTWRDRMDEESDPIFDEISKLTRLTSLQISFNNAHVFQDTDIFHDLKEFDICVGFSQTSFSHPILHVPTTRVIKLQECQLTGTETLLERAEEVVLEMIDDFKGIIICSSNREAFADLKTLYIYHCNNIECLARISQNEIQHTHQMWNSFCELTILEIKECFEIKYVFCKSVAKCLVQLQQLYISGCRIMEVIVMNEGTTSDGDIISFSKLKVLSLTDLPKLKSFYRKKNDVNSSSKSTMDNSVIPSDQFQPLFDGMVAFPSLEELHIGCLEHTSAIWGKCYTDSVSSFCKLKSFNVYECDNLEILISLAMLGRLRNLEEVYIRKCNSLRNMFLPAIARDLVHLEKMWVEDCNVMTGIIAVDEQEITNGASLFPKLTSTKLNELPNLTSLW